MKMDDKLMTFAKVSEGYYKEKGSKFISFAFPVNEEEDVKLLLQELKKKYADAQHHCYAFAIGTTNILYRVSDAGEPSHTAGVTILGQINSHGLTNVLIVVIRYFGGTKLGVGGLKKAYKIAAFEAIAANEIVEKTISTEICFSYKYEQTNEVMRVLATFDAEIMSQKFDSACEMKMHCRRSLTEELLFQLGKIPSLVMKNPGEIS